MKHEISTTETVSATISFDGGGVEEIFVETPKPDFVRIRQSVYDVDVPAKDFRAFIKVLAEWADAAALVILLAICLLAAPVPAFASDAEQSSSPPENAPIPTPRPVEEREA